MSVYKSQPQLQMPDFTLSKTVLFLRLNCCCFLHHSLYLCTPSGLHNQLLTHMTHSEHDILAAWAKHLVFTDCVTVVKSSTTFHSTREIKSALWHNSEVDWNFKYPAMQKAYRCHLNLAVWPEIVPPAVIIACNKTDNAAKIPINCCLPVTILSQFLTCLIEYLCRKRITRSKEKNRHLPYILDQSKQKDSNIKQQ